MQNCNIQLSPNFSKKKLFPYFFLEDLLQGLYGADLVAPISHCTSDSSVMNRIGELLISICLHC